MKHSEWLYFGGLELQNLCRGFEIPTEETQVGKRRLELLLCRKLGAFTGNDLFRMEAQRRAIGVPLPSFRCMCSLHLSSRFY